MTLIEEALHPKSKSIGSGISRTAYYSKTYNVVIKRERDCDQRQNKAEAKIFASMSEEEKRIFPIVSILYHEQQVFVVMKRVKPLSEFFSEMDSEDRYKDITDFNSLKYFYNKYQFSTVFIEVLWTFIKKWKVTDLHMGNIGIDDQNNLVLIDVGYSKARTGW